MLHLTPLHESLPESFIVPADQLLPATSAVVSLPVIDMSHSRDEVRRAILDAGKELGFFQVVNHGVPEQVIRAMEAACEEFFKLPAADKAVFCSEDRERAVRLFSGTTYDTGGEMYWRDCLRLNCTYPIGDSTKDWPDEHRKLRDIVEKFIVLARGVGMEILHLLCEGIGLRPDFFNGDLSGGGLNLDINHYPPCPNPSVTLGMPPHCDRELITILLPGPVQGLEVAYKGDWIKVEPVPNAFIVNFGLQLEVVTNGMLRSVEHRVVTNSELGRTSMATFIKPTADCLIGPAQELLNEDNPPCYQTLTFYDFMHKYNVIKLGSSLNLTTNIKNI